MMGVGTGLTTADCNINMVGFDRGLPFHVLSVAL